MINPFAPSRDSLVRQHVPQWMRSTQQPVGLPLQQAPWPPVKPAPQYDATRRGRLRKAPRPAQYPVSA